MLATFVFLQLTTISCVLSLPTIGALLGDVNTAVLVRDKRDPSRALTFSGFAPGSGMSAFASSADYSPYYRSRRPAYHPQQPVAWGSDEAKANYPHEQPSAVEQPPERGSADKPWAEPEEKPRESAEEEEEEEVPQAPARPTKKNKKKYTPKESDEDEEEYEKPSRSGGNAAASFNAWFPIMLGMFPSAGGYPGQGDEGGVSRAGHGQGSRYIPASHTTVIANSVSHGRSGVASSHAVAYGGGSSPYGGGSSPTQNHPHRR